MNPSGWLTARRLHARRTSGATTQCHEAERERHCTPGRQEQERGDGSNFTRKSDLFRALLERESRRRGSALTQSIDAVPYRFLPEVVGEWLRRQSSEQRDWDILNIEFSLAAARDPSLRPALRRAMDDFGAVLERKLGSADAKAEFTGRELATILDALATGLLMEQYLDPEGGQPELFTKAVRKLLAERPGEGANGS